MRKLMVVRAVMLAAILAMVLVATGCGSSKNKSAASAKPALTKAEFLKKGNAICKRGNQQINKAARTLFPNKKARPSQAQLKKFATGTLIPSVQRQINGVKALGAPKGDEAKVRAIVTSAQAALDQGKKDPLRLVSKHDPFTKSDKLAKAYGLTACGSGGGGG